MFLVIDFSGKTCCPFYCDCQINLNFRFSSDPYITPRTKTTLIFKKGSKYSVLDNRPGADLGGGGGADTPPQGFDTLPTGYPCFNFFK